MMEGGFHYAARFPLYFFLNNNKNEQNNICIYLYL